MTPEQEIDAAIKLIQDQGHHKGDMATRDGKHCLLGAMRHIQGWCSRCGINGSDMIIATQSTSIDAATDAAIEEGAGSLVQYNDHHCNSAEDAILLLKKAKERL